MPKMLLEAINIEKNYGDRRLLSIDRLAVYENERVGLIGENGAGKSTLLSILAGETRPDAGEVRLSCPVQIIHQMGETSQDLSPQAKAEFRAPEERQGLSGGELTRRRIAAALSQPVPLLLADEPTTDLDAQGIERLRKALKERGGALILISHDRALLNDLCGRIWHLEDGKITDFPGGYDAYQQELARRRERQQFEYDQYRAEQARLKASAQKMAERASSVRKAPSRMGNSEARLHKREWTDVVLQLSHAKRTLQNRMEQLEKKERPRETPDIRMMLGCARPIEAKTALSARCDRLEAGGRVLLSNARFTLPTGSRTALLGENGCGKTTLLSALTGQMPPGASFSGEIRFNPGARAAWFDQSHERTLRFDDTALQNALSDSSLDVSTARTVLARMNIRQDDVFKPVRLLSGGERAKVALAKLLLSDANLLILDEPTNHLDVFTLEALEELLSTYGGTLLLVSHDRAFVSKTASRVLRFEKGTIATYEETLPQMEARGRKNQDQEEKKLKITALEMRMAALSARLSAPKKGDRPEELNAQYQSLMEELRAAKREEK